MLFRRDLLPVTVLRIKHMKAIRGAITVGADTADEIKENVKLLLNEIAKQNSLASENVICIMFSSTSDIHSYYPAKAAREVGFFNCALFSSVEPEIFGSLPLCIRVMVLAETVGDPKHIYLKGAANLRKDITKKLNIAIDGPAGSGKSTVSKIISKRFDILYLDTGAMYRACALACVNSGIDCGDEAAVKSIVNSIDIGVKYENKMQRTYLNGEDVSTLIRTPEISMLASVVSAHGCIRTKMVELQRKIAAENSCVLDGRDIGTNVLPHAEFKFFLTASPEIRAHRRLAENKVKGYIQSFEDVLEEIKTRDKQDTTRKIAPLLKAEDAREIDTDTLSESEVADVICAEIQGKI